MFAAPVKTELNYPPEIAVVSTLEEAEKALFSDRKLGVVIPDGLFLNAQDRENCREFCKQHQFSFQAPAQEGRATLHLSTVLTSLSEFLDKKPDEDNSSFRKQYPETAVKIMQLAEALGRFSEKHGMIGKETFTKGNRLFSLADWKVNGNQAIHDDGACFQIIANVFGLTTYLFGADDVNIQEPPGIFNDFELKRGAAGTPAPEGSIVILKGLPHVGPYSPIIETFDRSIAERRLKPDDVVQDRLTLMSI